MVNVHSRCVTTLGVGKKPSSGEKWESFKILFHDFADLPSERGRSALSPKFTCNGHQWCLCIYPGGDNDASEGYVSVYLKHCSGGDATISYEICVLGKCQSVYDVRMQVDEIFTGKSSMCGWPNYYRRSDDVIERLDDEGTLAIAVSVKRYVVSSFVPSNPVRCMITKMFLDEETADVCFQVSDENATTGNSDEEASSPITLHAHRLILKACAPMLASLFGSEDDGIVTVSISDVKPAIFRHMLHYVYGGSVPDGEMKIHAKDIINAANKYSIVNLKLEAEAAYVESIEITMDNAVNKLLYADALHLALLKEAVMDFLAENHDEAIKKLSFADVPSPCDALKDLMVAFSRKMKIGTYEGSKEDLSTMRVSELRWELAELGLDVDGSREAMIEALTTNAQECADADDDDAVDFSEE